MCDHIARALWSSLELEDEEELDEELLELSELDEDELLEPDELDEDELSEDEDELLEDEPPNGVRSGMVW